MKKKAEFIITKAQMQMMAALYLGDKEITFFSNRQTLELRFIDTRSNEYVNRNIMLELSRKQLIRYDYKYLGFNLTKLGLKITKIKLKRGETNAATVVKPELMQMAREVKGALKTYNFLKV